MAGYKRLVPFRSAKYQFTGVFSILRYGKEKTKKRKKKKKKKDRFLEKSEMFLIIYDYSHSNIVYVCVLPVSIQAIRAKVCHI